MRQCVHSFCHCDDSSSIDSNSRKIVTVGEEKHAARVWRVKTVNEQYEMFLHSTTLEDYKNTYPDFMAPSRSFFISARCPCVSAPVMQSCVDITTSAVIHYMRAIGKFIRNNKDISTELKQCTCSQHLKPPNEQWQSYVNGYAEDFIEATCCPKVPLTSLNHGTGSMVKTPKLLKWKCIRGNCDECGVERKLDILKCKILGKCETEIDVLEWIYAKRQGASKGKQNTQLELGHSRLSVKDILMKLVAKLDVARLHQAHYEWRDTMRKIDLAISDPNKHRIFCTDFGVTLDLMGAEKDNSSVNNHAIIDIFFVAHS